MKRVAFVFRSAPHGSSAGREGLDALLASSALSEDIGVFFINDGVFQLLGQQRPTEILARDYIATFKVLGLYDIEQCYLCSRSLEERGLTDYQDWVLDATQLDPQGIRDTLADFDVVLTF